MARGLLELGRTDGQTEKGGWEKTKHGVTNDGKSNHCWALLYELFQAIITTLTGGFYGSEICIAGSYRINECSNYNDGDCGSSSGMCHCVIESSWFSTCHFGGERSCHEVRAEVMLYSSLVAIVFYA